MKTKQLLITTLLLVSTLFVFGQENDDFIKFYKDNLVGLKNNQGQILIPAKYDDIELDYYLLDHEYYNNLLINCFIIVKDGYKGVYNNILNREIITAKYSYITFKSNSPTIIANTEEKKIAFNHKGDVLLSIPKYSNGIEANISVYQDCIVRYYGDNGKFYNLSGRPLEIKEGEVFPLSISNNNIIDRKGDTPPDFFGMYDRSTDSYSLINKYGKLICSNISESSYGKILFTHDSLIVINKKSNYIFITSDGNHFFPENIDFEKYYMFSDGISLARKGDKWGYINNKGDILIPFQFQEAREFKNNRAQVIIDDKIGIINKSGKYILHPIYTYISDIQEDRYRLILDSRFGLADTNGDYVLHPIYEYISPFKDGISKTIKNDSLVYVDINGKVHESKSKPELFIPSYNETYSVHNLTFSFTEKYFAFDGGQDYPSILLIWDMQQEKEIRKIDIDKLFNLSQITSFCFSPDEKNIILLCSDENKTTKICVFNLNTGVLINEFDYAQFNAFKEYDHCSINRITTNSSGSNILFSTDKKIIVIDFWTGKIQSVFDGFNNMLNISNDNNYIASIKTDSYSGSQIVIHDLEKNKKIDTIYNYSTEKSYWGAYFSKGSCTLNISFNPSERNIEIQKYNYCDKKKKAVYTPLILEPITLNPSVSIYISKKSIKIINAKKKFKYHFDKKGFNWRYKLSPEGNFIAYHDNWDRNEIIFYNLKVKENNYTYKPMVNQPITDIKFSINGIVLKGGDTTLLIDDNGLKLIKTTKVDDIEYTNSNYSADKEEYLLVKPIAYMADSMRIETKITEISQYSESFISNDLDKIFILSEEISVFNLNNNKKICEIRKMGYKKWIINTPDYYYSSINNAYQYISFVMDGKLYPFEQFDLKYNRPDIILDRLGYADSSLIAAYHQAYLKRLKKMNFTEDMLKDDFHLPEIKIENFEEMPTITDSSSVGLNLQLNDSKYKLDRINVWVNDVAVYGSNGISLRDKEIQEYKTNLKVSLVKGKNKVQVSVLNQAGAESYKETFEVECKTGKEKPDLYLITIGESKFKQANYNLTYAAKDAHDVAALFAKSKNYGQVITKTLTNDQVTKVNIIALRSFLEQAGINDEVMIFIAGHGVLDENLDYFFASYDMDFNNPNKRGIAYEDLEGLLDGIKPLKKVLLIDACHSGEIDKEEVELLAVDETVAEGGIQFRAVGNSVKPKLGMQNTSELTKALFTDLRKGTGATVISSAGGGEYAMESGEWKNGLFTYCMLKGIETNAADLNGDGEIWLKELQEYVQTQVSELSGGKQQPTSRIENSVLDYRVW